MRGSLLDESRSWMHSTSYVTVERRETAPTLPALRPGGRTSDRGRGATVSLRDNGATGDRTREQSDVTRRVTARLARLELSIRQRTAALYVCTAES